MKEILDFYTRLADNNCKPWFDEHRDEYEATKKKLAVIATQLIEGIAAFDPRCEGLQVKDVTYRINRDIRFSKDKRPYKDWHGIYVCPKGKKSGMAGYYVHLEPAHNLFFLCGGLYNPDKDILKSVREQIMLEPEEFHEAVEACGKGYHLNWEGALHNVPAGYNKDDVHSEYYRLRTYEIYKPLTLDDVLRPDFIERAVRELRKCHPFNELLNKCVDYARDTE